MPLAFRDSFAGFGPSPARHIYAKRDGKLLLPLDLTFLSFNPDITDSEGRFNGASIKMFGTDAIAQIDSYPHPTAGNIIPVITAPLIFDLNVPSAPPLSSPNLPSGTRVVVVTDFGAIGGDITKIGTFAYPNLASTIAAYEVRFDTMPLIPDTHGAPVFLEADLTQLIGMLINVAPIQGGLPLVAPV